MREYDLIIFGATGFTGRRIAREAAAHAAFSFALAGRSRARLDALAAELAASAGRAPGGVLLADARDPGSLAAMAAAGRVVVAAAGPFRFLGEPVLAACIESGADYLDVCGEPEFIERMELERGAAAAAAGILAASACGFDSAPGDLGAAWAAGEAFPPPPARCASVDAYITLRGGAEGLAGHYATWASAVHGYAAARELAALRRRAAAARGAAPRAPRAAAARRRGPHYDAAVGKWVLPFMGADASVARRTAAALERGAAAGAPPRPRPAFWVTVDSVWALALVLAHAAVFAFLAGRAWGRRALLAHPRLFSRGVFTHAGPSERQLRETRFAITFVARGASSPSAAEAGQADVEVVARVAGPEPGYVACSIFVVAAAAVLLEERAAAGGGAPGVHTPATLLRGTTYVDRLRRRGIEWGRAAGARAAL